MKYKKLFSPYKLGPLELKNRIVFPAVATQYHTPEGYPTEKSIEWYEKRAKGGAGLIVIEAAGIHQRPSGCLMRIKDDTYIDGIKSIADTIHKHGAKCGIQLVHWLSVSKEYRAEPTTIDTDEIKAIIEQFVAASKRVQAAGVDYIQLHAAHAYTFASFLSPAANRRKDDYGGSVKKRARILLETIQAIKQECGEDTLVNCRINGDDFISGGLTNYHAVETARLLEKAGCFYLDVSAGGRYEDGEWYTGYSGLRCIPSKASPECCNLYLMENVRKAVNVPVQGVGRIPMPDVAEKVLQEDRVDLVGICRPIIADPEWPNKAREGREDEIVQCTYCNNCIDKDRHFHPVDCTQWKDGRFKALPKGTRLDVHLTYDKIGYNYIPHVEHFPPRD